MYILDLLLIPSPVDRPQPRRVPGLRPCRGCLHHRAHLQLKRSVLPVRVRQDQVLPAWRAQVLANEEEREGDEEDQDEDDDDDDDAANCDG